MSKFEEREREREREKGLFEPLSQFEPFDRYNLSKKLFMQKVK